MWDSKHLSSAGILQNFDLSYNGDRDSDYTALPNALGMIVAKDQHAPAVPTHSIQKKAFFIQLLKSKMHCSPRPPAAGDVEAQIYFTKKYHHSTSSPRPPARYGRLQVDVHGADSRGVDGSDFGYVRSWWGGESAEAQDRSRDGVECAELLLPVRERGVDTGTG